MKRTITTLFSKREERGRDLARRAAAAALALTLLWTGAVGVAASAAEPAPAAPAVLEDENGLGGFQLMTEELAAEDPLAARYETVTPDAAGRITLTPEQFTAALENQSIDWDEENCLRWLFDWLFGWLF